LHTVLQSYHDLSCNCLELLGDDAVAEGVANGALHFLKQAKAHRQAHVMTALRYSQQVKPQESKHRVFFLPLDYTAAGTVDAETLAMLQNHQVCKSSLMTVTCTGRRFWETCENALERGHSPKHGLAGKDSNRAKEFVSLVAPDLREFFEDMEDLAEPRATRLVREQTSIGIREEETGRVYLAPSFTKRNLYARFCNERGWTVKSDHKSNLTIVERTDTDWTDGEPKKCCSWVTFRRFWRKEFPDLYVR